jgi:antirestriction protein
MTIYIDSDYKCYTTAADDRRAVETEAFDGKCRQYIEGYRFVPTGESWTRSDGEVFTGEMVSPWRDYELLAEFQALYEEEQAKAADMKAALEVLGVTE